MNDRDNQPLREANTGFGLLPRAYMPDLPLADVPDDTVADRHLMVVRARLVANLGSALASWFQIAPSDHAAGELHMVALLLEAHLPILVPVNDLETGPVFFVAEYDIGARRLRPASQRDRMAAYTSLADALLAADTGFQQLKTQAAIQGPALYPRISSAPAELPEEKWLRHQLARRMASAEVTG